MIITSIFFSAAESGFSSMRKITVSADIVDNQHNEDKTDEIIYKPALAIASVTILKSVTPLNPLNPMESLIPFFKVTG